MNNKLRKILNIIFLIALLGFLIYYISKNREDFSSINLVNPLNLIILILLFLLGYVIVAFVYMTILKHLNINIKFPEAFMISIVTAFYNLITPFKGGMAVRAVYLKTKYNFSITDFFASLSASYVIIFFISSLTGLFSIYMIYLNEKIFSSIIFAVFLITFILMSFIIIFSPKSPQTKSAFINKFIRAVNGWHLIKDDKRVIFTLMFLSLLQVIIAAIIYYLDFQVFGIDVSVYNMIFLVSIGFIGIVFSITPANLGVQEAIIVFSALTLGISPIESLSVSILFRIIQSLILFILGPIFSYILLDNNTEQQTKSILLSK